MRVVNMFVVIEFRVEEETQYSWMRVLSKMNMRLFDLDETCMLVCLEGVSMSEMYMLKSVDE